MPDHVRTITAIVHRYCHLFDSGDFDGFAEQFAHGSWHRAGHGRDAVRQWIADNVVVHDGSPCTQHATTNLIVDVDEAAGRATASSYVTVFQAAPGFPLQPIFAGRYLDTFELVDGDWRWLERRVESLLRGDTSHHVRAR